MAKKSTDFANLTVNITTLAAVVAFVWGAATMYQKAMDRLGDMQSQIGEANERLDRMEAK